MSDPNTPNPHHISTRKAVTILVVALAGVGLGSFLVIPHIDDKARKPSALSHVVPQSFISRETNGMMWIPSGAFFMGAETPASDETPLHLVTLNGFWMDKTEVTNEAFRKFVAATGYKTTAEQAGSASTWLTMATESRSNHPVVYVSWQDAVAYAKWAGKRLPTEAEWECAARGGLDRKPYPWGANHTFPPGVVVARFATNSTVAVSSYGPNGYGLLDIAGNVAEWSADYFGPVLKEEINNPHGPKSSTTGERVVRGGSFGSSLEGLKVTVRTNLLAEHFQADLGFRCVR